MIIIMNGYFLGLMVLTLIVSLTPGLSYHLSKIQTNLKAPSPPYNYNPTTKLKRLDVQRDGWIPKLVTKSPEYYGITRKQDDFNVHYLPNPQYLTGNLVYNQIQQEKIQPQPTSSYENNLQSHLDELSHEHVQKLLEQAQREAMEKVRLQHEALEKTKLEAEKEALAKIEAHNSGSIDLNSDSIKLNSNLINVNSNLFNSNLINSNLINSNSNLIYSNSNLINSNSNSNLINSKSNSINSNPNLINLNPNFGNFNSNLKNFNSNLENLNSNSIKSNSNLDNLNSNSIKSNSNLIKLNSNLDNLNSNSIKSNSNLIDSNPNLINLNPLNSPSIDLNPLKNLLLSFENKLEEKDTLGVKSEPLPIPEALINTNEDHQKAIEHAVQQAQAYLQQSAQIHLLNPIFNDGKQEEDLNDLTLRNNEDVSKNISSFNTENLLGNINVNENGNYIEGKLANEVSPVKNEEIEDYNEDYLADEYAPNYKFGYQITDYHSGNDFGHEEIKDGKMTKGQYHILLPDGRTQSVEYWADSSGYHAKVTYSNLGKHR